MSQLAWTPARAIGVGRSEAGHVDEKVGDHEESWWRAAKEIIMVEAVQVSELRIPRRPPSTLFAPPTGNERRDKVQVVDQHKNQRNSKAEEVSAPRLLVFAMADCKRPQKRNNVVLCNSLEIKRGLVSGLLLWCATAASLQLLREELLAYLQDARGANEARNRR